MDKVDYSKIEIFLPKLNAYYLMSIEFCIFSMYAVFSSYIVSNDDAYIYFIALILFTIALIKFLFKIYNYMGINLFQNFLILFFTVFIINLFSPNLLVITLIISNIFSLIYAYKSISLLARYNSEENVFLDKYKDIVNINEYTVFFPLLIFFAFFVYVIIYTLNFSIFMYILTLFNNNDMLQTFVTVGKVLVNIPFIYLSVLFMVTSILSWIYLFSVQKYQYLFIVCYLSEYGEIPIDVVTKSLKNRDKDDIVDWYNLNIGSYVKNTHLDIDRKVIVFDKAIIPAPFKDDKDVIDISDYKSSETPKLYSLDNAVKKLERLMAKAVYKGTNLIKPLYNMRLYLDKINQLHTNKLSYDKYIDRINNKYIPYTEYLVNVYLRNIDLNDKSLEDIQDKIIYTIDEIGNVIRAVYENKIDFMKFSLDVELDAVDLMIKQTGYYKDKI